jgi:AraC-like DNA-binding protein
VGSKATQRAAADGSRARVVHGQVGSAPWEIATRAPAPGVRAYVRGDYVGYTERSAGVLRRVEFPGAQVVVIVEFGPPLRVYDLGSATRWARHAGGFAAGVGDGPTMTEYDGFQSGLQINLTPLGARFFFDLPMSELAGRAVTLDDLLPRRVRPLAERLAALPDWDARFDLVDELLAQRIAASRVDARVVAWACRRIEAAGGAVDVRALARELGYSHKHVIALFRQHVGVAPKLLARLARFERVIQRLQAGAAGTWAELAVEAGYYDHAHLARELRALTGATPTGVRARVSELGAQGLAVVAT